MTRRRGPNYLNNKDMLKQIHQSKSNHCWFEDRQLHHQYDCIIDGVEEVDVLNEMLKRMDEAKENRASRMQTLSWDTNTDDSKRKADFLVDTSTFADEDMVFRVMTYDHIPDDPDRKRNPKSIADTKVKVNFPPFKHYVLENGKAKCVGISHYGSKTKAFDSNYGKITATLANMYIKIVERISQRSNWRGYSYVDEMRGQALLQLADIGLQFNEMKSDNPFSYYTAIVNNSFTRVLNKEKKAQSLRDDLLESIGQAPSWTRQLEHELQAHERWQKVKHTSLNDEDDEMPTEVIKEIYSEND